MPPSPKKYPKRRLAEIQILRAIKVLEEDNDPVSALTLAGAAEEILGKILRTKGLRCSFDNEVDFGKKFWDFARDKIEGKKLDIPIPSESEIKERINHTRNELKHKCSGRPVMAFYNLEAEDMIIRAINNYLVLYQKLPKQKYISNWYDFQTL